MSVQRFDKIEAPDWMIQKFTPTPEGFLSGRACVTNIGIFPYKLDDGTIEYELRHPDDVFNQDSMNSLMLKPITNNHPPEMLTPANVNKYQVGNLGDNPINGDNIHLTIAAILQDAEAIAAVNAGKRELSCGYTADVVDESGVWMGMPYTKRQKNIRYNHVALVDTTRAGEAACIKLDSGGGEMINVININKSAAGAVNIKEDIMPDMKIVKLDDGVDYQAEAQVIAALTTAKKELDSVTKNLTGEKSKISALEAERDSLKESNEKLKVAQVDTAKIDALVATKLKILAYAKKADIEVKTGMTDEAIVTAVIMKQFPKAVLTGKDKAYIDSRFDCACEEIDAAVERGATASVNTVGAGITIPGVKVDAAKDAEKRYQERTFGKKD
jgi:uncharacterized protein